MTDLMTTISAALTRRGFTVHHAATKEEAARLVLSLIPEGASVGAGGSMTIRELALAETLQAAGHAVHWHWLEAGAAAFPAAHAADVYLASANAVTLDGQLVNIDGTGNRVAAMCYGPNTVYVIIGRNKIVEGGYQQAVRRIKQVACPANARRLNLDTPCAKGECSAAQCKNPMCCAVVSLEHAVSAHRMVVLLVDEALGF